MKNKLISFVLVLVLTMSVCAVAFATEKDLAPGEKLPDDQRPIYSITSSPTFTVILKGCPGDIVTVNLDLEDTRPGKAKWQDTGSKKCKITTSGKTSFTIKVGSKYHFQDCVINPRARLRFAADAKNTRSVHITYKNP